MFRTPRKSVIRSASGRLFPGCAVLVLFPCAPVATAAEKPAQLIGYTEGRNNLEGGQFVNWVTNRACVVGADGTGRRVLGEELMRQEHSWTQFA